MLRRKAQLMGRFRPMQGPCGRTGHGQRAPRPATSGRRWPRPSSRSTSSRRRSPRTCTPASCRPRATPTTRSGPWRLRAGAHRRIGGRARRVPRGHRHAWPSRIGRVAGPARAHRGRRCSGTRSTGSDFGSVRDFLVVPGRRSSTSPTSRSPSASSHSSWHWRSARPGPRPFRSRRREIGESTRPSHSVVFGINRYTTGGPGRTTPAGGRLYAGRDADRDLDHGLRVPRPRRPPGRRGEVARRWPRPRSQANEVATQGIEDLQRYDFNDLGRLLRRGRSGARDDPREPDRADARCSWRTAVRASLVYEQPCSPPAGTLTTLRRAPPDIHVRAERDHLQREPVRHVGRRRRTRPSDSRSTSTGPTRSARTRSPRRARCAARTRPA